MDQHAVERFAERYTAAWCSHDDGQVALFFAEDGVLAINDQRPAVGRDQIAAAVRAFVSDLPDLLVHMDGTKGTEAGGYRYRWTLTGTASGHRPVRISGHENWTFTTDGLIATSHGSYDAADYARQTAS